jgi:hypothetical protein
MGKRLGYPHKLFGYMNTWAATNSGRLIINLAYQTCYLVRYDAVHSGSVPMFYRNLGHGARHTRN